MTTTRKKLTPEENIARAEAALEKAKSKAREEETKALWRNFYEVRNSLADFRDISTQVDEEVDAIYFQTITNDEFADEALGIAYEKARIDVDADDYALQLEAMTAGVKAARETFTKLYRQVSETAIKAYFARPQAERDAEVAAQIAKNAVDARKSAEWNTAFEAEMAAELAMLAKPDDGDKTPPSLRLVK